MVAPAFFFISSLNYLSIQGVYTKAGDVNGRGKKVLIHYNNSASFSFTKSNVEKKDANESIASAQHAGVIH